MTADDSKRARDRRWDASTGIVSVDLQDLERIISQVVREVPAHLIAFECRKRVAIEVHARSKTKTERQKDAEAMAAVSAAKMTGREVRAEVRERAMRADDDRRARLRATRAGRKKL